MERILLVDDEKQNRYILSRVLQHAGFAVDECATGKTGLEVARTSPDAAIIDVKLPDISGYEVCRRIKADPAMARMPVLLISANFGPNQQVRELAQAGADSYLTHPVDPEDLVKKVRSLIHPAQQRVVTD